MKTIWGKYKFFILVILMIATAIVNVTFSFAVTGDKPNQMKLSAFGNISNSHQTCTKGELRANRHKMYFCYSTNTFGKYSSSSF